MATTQGNEQTFSSINPATGEINWTGTAAGPEAVAAAIATARKAFGTWRRLSFDERAGHLQAFAATLEKSQDTLAAAISRDIGKPRWEAKMEVQSMITKCEITIDAHQKRCGEHGGGGGVTRFRPHGVVGVLGPFNFPGHLPNGHIMPALLAGNTVVLKPSDKAPLTAEETMRLWQESGLPDGVLNLVQGGVPTAIALAGHPGIDGIFFTGSSQAGIRLNELFASQPGKILSLEMGGNSPLVVHDPGDLKAAAVVAAQSAFISAGQRCSCARRLIVTQSMPVDDFLGRLVRIAGSLRVSGPDEEDEPFHGPLVSEAAAEAFMARQETLRSLGAKPLLEGRRLKPGTALVSSAIWDVTGVKGLGDEELFAPLLQVVRVETLADAIREANATAYGLAAGILCKERSDYETFLAEARAGVVNWNQPLPGARSAAPFGGIGLSGNHRPSAYFAADYCSYPMTSLESETLAMPKTLPPGFATN